MNSEEVWINILIPLLFGQLFLYLKTIYDNYPELQTKILVASIRNLDHVIESAIIGADVVTIPPNVLEMLYDHPLTKKGLEAFLNDWKSTNQSIL